MSYLRTYLPYLFGNKKGQTYKLPEDIPWGTLSFEEALMLQALQGTINTYLQEIKLQEITAKNVLHIFNFWEFLSTELKIKFSNAFPNEFHLFKEGKSARPLSVFDMQDVLDFKNQELTLYAIVPSNRRYLGKLLIKKKNGEFVKDSSGSIWSIPILAWSGRGLSFHHINGYTPMGVYSIDGVMPKADKFYAYGKYRRLIVNFSKPENLLPVSQKHKAWWKQAQLAKELGRSLLRIHGTGRVNRNPFSPFFPFVPTSGCLATNETNFFGFKINDQRRLLDMMMTAQGLSPSYENEEKLKAILYVVEFNESFNKLSF